MRSRDPRPGLPTAVVESTTASTGIPARDLVVRLEPELGIQRGTSGAADHEGTEAEDQSTRCSKSIRMTRLVQATLDSHGMVQPSTAEISGAGAAGAGRPPLSSSPWRR